MEGLTGLVEQDLEEDLEDTDETEGNAQPRNVRSAGSSTCFTVEVNQPDWWKEKQAKLKAGDKDKDKGKTSGDASGSKRSYMTRMKSPTETTTRAELVVDTGASNHMSNQRQWFSTFSKIVPIAIETSNNSIIYAIGIGSIVFKPDGHPLIELKNVYYIPDLSCTLFSLSILPDDVTFQVQRSVCSFIRHNEVEMVGNRASSGLFIIHGNVSLPTQSALTTSSVVVPVNAPLLAPMVELVEDPTVAVAIPAATDSTKSTPKTTKSKSSEQAELWHNRLGHINLAKLRLLLRLNLLDIDLDPHFEEPAACNSCIKAKIARSPFKPSNPSNRATRPLEVIHSDIMGPLGASMGFDSFDGTPLNDAYYTLTFFDEHSKKIWVHSLTYKSEAYATTQEFFQFMRGRFLDKPIRTFRTDGGGEYDGTKFQTLFRKYGIYHDTTTPYSPQQNGSAERMNRTLVESARAMLFQQNLSLRFWSDAIATAAHIYNLLPTVPHGQWFRGNDCCHPTTALLIHRPIRW